MFLTREKCIILLLLTLHTQIWAAQEKDDDYFLKDTDKNIIKDVLPKLDKTQQWLGSQVDNFGETIDKFIIADETFHRTKGSRLDILTFAAFDEYGKVVIGNYIRTKIHLPRLNKRLNIIANTTSQKVKKFFKGKTKEKNSNTRYSTDNRNNTELGLQFKIKSNNYSIYFLDTGVLFNGLSTPDTFIRTKGFYKIDVNKKLKVKYRQEFFYRILKGFGSYTEQTIDYSISDVKLFRSSTYMNWLYSKNYYNVGHDFLYYPLISNRRTIYYDLSAYWDNYKQNFQLEEVSLGVDWKENIYKSWIFFSIHPEIAFENEKNFKVGHKSIIFTLEARFYDMSVQKHNP